MINVSHLTRGILLEGIKRQSSVMIQSKCLDGVTLQVFAEVGKFSSKPISLF